MPEAWQSPIKSKAVYDVLMFHVSLTSVVFMVGPFFQVLREVVSAFFFCTPT